MDPILTKAVTPTVSDSFNGLAGTQPPKNDASQFDKIKAQLQSTTDQVSSYAPPHPVLATAPTPPSSVASPQSSSAEAQPADSGTKTNTGTVGSKTISSLPPGAEKVQRAMAAGRYHLDRIHTIVDAKSSTCTLDKVKGKLTSIEAQYNHLDTTLQQISPNASPQDWLRLQQMANSMNENISVLSKLVDSASSGVKTILQTQI
jgi:hypothetical protein